MTLYRVAPQNRLRAVLRFLTPSESIAKISLPARLTIKLINTKNETLFYSVRLIATLFEVLTT